MICRLYLRFCASINYFFERVRKDDDPGVLALLFITVLASVYSFGLFYSIELFAGRKIGAKAYYFYGLFILFGVLNYFFVFRKEQVYEYYKTRLNIWTTLFLIFLGYAFIFL